MPEVGQVRSLGSATLNAGVGRSVKWWEAWSGVAWAPWWGTHGSVIAAGGGHDTDGEANDVARLDIATGAWSMIKSPPADWYMKPDTLDIADRAGAGWMWANATVGDATMQTGESPTQHHYGALLALPESAIPGLGATNGWLFHAGTAAIPKNGAMGSAMAHKLRMGIDQQYTLHGTPPHSYNHGNTGAAYDSARRRVWFSQQTMDPSSTLRYKDLDGASEGSLTLSGGIEWGLSYDSINYSPSNDCLVRVLQRFGVSDWSDLLVLDLAAGQAYRPAQTAGASAPATPNASFAATWVEAWGCVAYLRGQGEQKVHFLKPTGNPRTDAWAWSSQDITTSGGEAAIRSSDGGNPAFNRLGHVPSLGNVLLWCAKASEPVQLIHVTPP